MKRLIRLYPARWRQRYGEEMARLLDDLDPVSPAARLSTGLNLLLGAVDAHLSREFRTATGATRAIGLAAGTAVIGWLPVAALIVLSTAVFPVGSNDAISSAAGYLYLMAAFVVIGAIATRNCVSPRVWLATGAVAGVIMATLINATFAAVDNVFLGIVIKDPEKMAEFHASGMTSMRDFINVTLERQVVGITILLGVMGLLLGTMGAIGGVSLRENRRRRTAA